MIVIFGLGNPGEKYKNNRHNAGFQILDIFAEKNDCVFNEQKILLSDVANYENKILLVKPQTFMNHSGDSVLHILKNYPIKLLVVLYDDIDIEIGEVKCSYNRGAGGHNGVQNIIDRLGHKNFLRIRFGVRPIQDELKNMIAPPNGFEKFLLSNFISSEKKEYDIGVEKVINIIKDLSVLDIEKIMNKYN